ncbi:MAG: hypothetical protein WAM75_07460 [Xanthobacteraceae bacterium]
MFIIRTIKRVLGPFWRALKAIFDWIEAETSLVKKLSIYGVVSTLVIAYFQSLSAYHDRVATLAKDDISAAAQTFAEISSDLSGALALQRRLISDFYVAVPNDVYKNDAAFPTKDARTIYKDYNDSYASLHENYNLLARKAEMYLDWPSDPDRDPAETPSPIVDPINMSLLGAANFDCETSMPSFGAKQQIPIKDPINGKTYTIDWHSALHNVLTIEYCFDVTHAGIAGILQWAAQTNIDQKQWAYLTSLSNTELFNKTRATNQVLRLNAFTGLAMNEIEQIRVKYRPPGFICSLPAVSEILSLFDSCTPVPTKAPWSEKVATKASP